LIHCEALYWNFLERLRTHKEKLEGQPFYELGFEPGTLNCDIQWLDDDEVGGCDDRTIRFEKATIMKLMMTKRQAR
jgi:hypothetical protein